MKTSSFLFATAMAAMANDVPLAFASNRKHGSNNDPVRRPAHTRRRVISTKGSKKSDYYYSSSVVMASESVSAPQNLFIPKSGKASSSKSSKSSSNSSVGSGTKSSKSEGAKAGKAELVLLHHAAVHSVNPFTVTDPYPIVQITNPPTPQPTITPTLIPAVNQTESIKTAIAENNDYSCTGAPCAEEGWCRTPYGTCGPGRIYCNDRASWTVVCPSWSPSKGPTKVEMGRPTTLDPTTGSPTAFMTTLAPIVMALENTIEPTSAPMVEALPIMTTESPVNDLTRGDTYDNLEEVVEGVEIDNSFLEGEGVETSDTNLQREQEQDNPTLPSVVTVRTDDGSSNNGKGEGSGGFPALGYAAIGLGAALSVGAGVIIKTELSQRALLSSQ